MKSLGFYIYLLFATSWFLHLGTRVPVLGEVRIDLILVAILTLLAIEQPTRRDEPTTKTDTWLRVLIIYSVATIPFVEWPGSVVRYGIEALVKGVVFYYFTVVFVDSESRLKTFITVFVGCQLFRVMEPLYLHVFEGYWGTFATMAHWEVLNRLSGAPSDIVNPNGLAFIICTALPFLWFLAGLSWINRLMLLLFMPLCVYALMLTGSRTGLVGLLVIALGIIAKARRRFALTVGFLLIGVIGFPMLSADFQDRYLSILGLSVKNEATAQLRVAGLEVDLEVALRRPIFGHGLGTSREARANFAGWDQPSHNLYAEAAVELGFIGMVIFILLIVSIISGFQHSKRAYAGQQTVTFLSRVLDAMQVWLLLNIAFSFASYGLTSYEWYLLGGLAVVLQRLAPQAAAARDGAAERVSALRGQEAPCLLAESDRERTL